MKVRIVFESEYLNPNAPHIYDPDETELREAIERVVERNRKNLLWLDNDKRIGMFERNSFKDVFVDVKVARTCAGSIPKLFARLMRRWR